MAICIECGREYHVCRSCEIIGREWLNWYCSRECAERDGWVEEEEEE